MKARCRHTDATKNKRPLLTGAAFCVGGGGCGLAAYLLVKAFHHAIDLFALIAVHVPIAGIAAFIQFN